MDKNHTKEKPHISRDEIDEIWRADDLLINVASGKVEKRGEEIPISGLTFDLLVALIRAAPAYVTQEELIASVWQGRVVSPETVVQRVKLLREALGDDASDPQYVGLVRGRGYKMLPPAQRLGEPDTGQIAPRNRKYLALGAICLLLLLTVLLFPGGEQPFESNQPTRAGIAVLPFSFQGTTGEDADFFAIGVHDDIITELSRIEDLVVISRTSVLSYRDAQRPISDIGRELNVDKILEGNVQRSAGKVKINVQLIEAATDKHLWAQGYERELSVANIITIQRQIATDVARALRLSLADPSPDQAMPTQNITAYDHYLLARQSVYDAVEQVQQPGTFNLARNTLESASKHLLAAINEDPEFADAYALLSLTYSLKSRVAISDRQALLNKSATALLEAMKIAPDRPRVRNALSSYYFSIGEEDKGLVELERASTGLPQDAGIKMALAMKTLMAGQAERSLALADSAIAHDPMNVRALKMLTVIRWFGEDMQGALDANRRARALSPEDIGLAYMEATFSFATTGDLPAYRNAIHDLPIQDAQGVRAHWEAAFLSRDYDEALKILQTGPQRTWITFADYTPNAYLRGITHLLAGAKDMATEEMKKAERELESVRSNDPEDTRILARIAGVHAALGEKQLARDAVQAVLASSAYQHNAVFARIWRRMLIEALLLNGDADPALDLLEVSARNPGSLPITPFILHPIFDRVRNNPRFLEIVQNAPQPKPSGRPEQQR